MVTDCRHLPLEMVICAWCDTTVARPTASPSLGAPAVSHGLCPKCLDRQLARAAAPVLPALPAAAS
ncbi:MAG: hypothetical protein MJE66_07345 [Proteobacteria bacterium]|nr:hypothetical protein [Pseudomonadota bacterium]